MPINIIVAFSQSSLGIGYNGKLPWDIPEDLVHFSKLTRDSVVVMGRKTWESIPHDKRPLKGRLNVVVTHTPSKYKHQENVVFLLMEELDAFISKHTNVFIIGGACLYARFMGTADCIFATLVETNTQCDSYFPTDRFDQYTIKDYSPLMLSDRQNMWYRFVTYIKSNKKHDEYAYLDNMRSIVNNGKKRSDRTGTGTMSLFGGQLRFDISKAFPLLTTKFVGYKSVLKELLFFLRGQTDSKLLEAQGVNIWKANTTREFLDNRGLYNYPEGCMGKMYGFNWRFFGAQYDGPHTDYRGQGYDQLHALINGLQTDPYSRRHMLTTYNPSEVDQCVLAPCHGIVTQFYVDDGDDGNKHISCHVYNRSQDTFLGQSWNIASYAALTYIIAKKCNMFPRELIISIGDGHVYLNHLEQAATQLERSPLPFPVLEVSDAIKDKGFDEITIDDFNLVAYLHHSAIKAPMAV